MGVFRKNSMPPSTVPTEELGLRKPERTASSSESIASSKMQPSVYKMEMEEYPPLYEFPQQKPQLITRVPSIQTQYMSMLLHLDEIPRLHNILAALSTWILLAGFLVVPGTFTSFKDSATFENASQENSNTVEAAILHSINHIGLLWVSGACCIIGALGACALWLRWRKNYVWLINRIFFPAMLNSIAGVLTTIVNVYTAQKGVFSVTAKITAIVTGSCTGVTLLLFVLYNNWILEKVKETHVRELQPQEQHETSVEKIKRKARMSALEPGSVV